MCVDCGSSVLVVLLACVYIIIILLFGLVLGLLTECIGVAEKKDVAQFWLLHNWSEEIPHTYGENDFLIGGGYCLK